VSLSSFSRVFPPITGVVLAFRSALWAGVADSARATSVSASALASVTSAAALMPARPGEPSALLVMVLMVVCPSFFDGGPLRPLLSLLS
jgi:hypothetical protein